MIVHAEVNDTVKLDYRNGSRLHQRLNMTGKTFVVLHLSSEKDDLTAAASSIRMIKALASSELHLNKAVITTFPKPHKFPS